ncbi:MAG: glycosyltransferase [Thermodesulfobacteriota bacterium]
MNYSDNKIFISLVVLTYNRPSLLKNCLESIKNLESGGFPFEVIVIDDGSKFDNSQIVNEFNQNLKIRCYKKIHQGVAAARNCGVKLAHGNFISFIADDYCLPKNFLIDVFKFFDEQNDAQVITHNILPCGPSIFKYVQRLYFHLALWQSIENFDTTLGALKSYSLPPSRGAVFRKEVFQEVGLFNEYLLTGEDGEFGIRMSSRGIPVYFFPNKHIEHWEQKNLWGYLGQRMRYGASHFKALSTTNNDSELHKLSFFRIFVLFFGRKNFIWMKLAWEINRGIQYLLLSPFIVLFLLFFYWGFYKESKQNSISYRNLPRFLIEN